MPAGRFRPLLALASLAGCASVAPVPPEPPAPALSIESIEDLPRAERIPRLIEGLRSGDPALALACAAALPPECLDLEELRLQCDLLVAHPREALGSDGLRSLGSPDVLRFLGAAVEKDVEMGSDSLREFHRMMIPDHVPGLAALLEPARGQAYQDLLWMLALLADNSDLHRDEVARALLYAQAAAVAELRGAPPPRLADFSGARADGPTLDRLAETAGPDGPLGAYAFPLPDCWMARARGQVEKPAAAGPEAFSPSEARERIASLLAARPTAGDDEAWEAFAREAPLLEAAAPDALEGLLRAWKDAPTRFEEGWISRLLEHMEERPGWRDRDDFPGEAAPPGDRLREALEGDPGAGTVARLGLLGSPALPVLRRLREDRARELHWPATAGLAIAGDARARAEFLALLASDRTFAYDGFFGDPVLLTLNGDPAALAHWRSRLGANCCLWNHADRVLSRWYPTMPCMVRVGDHDGTAARAAAWWERWKDRLRWSRLADGWVPVAE